MPGHIAVFGCAVREETGVMWRTWNIIFAGINQPGSNNNFQQNISAGSPAPTDNNTHEYTDRNNANIACLNKAFDDAAADPKDGQWS